MIYNNVNDELFDQAQNGEDNSKEMNEIDDNNMIIAKKTLLNRRKNKMKIQNFLKLDSLKMHINSLNEELITKKSVDTKSFKNP